MGVVSDVPWKLAWFKPFSGMAAKERWFYRSKGPAYLSEFKKTQYYSLDQIQDYQLERLRVVLTRAYNECPFYRDFFDKAGVHPNDLKSLDDLSLFPMLEKQDIQERRDDLISRSYAQNELIENHTGGSTGSPLYYFHNKERMESMAAGTIRHDRWTSWDVGDWKATIWGAPQDMMSNRSLKSKLRSSIIDRTLWLNATTVTEESILTFVKALNRYSPSMIVGYANALLLFSRYLKEHNLSVPPPKGVISTAGSAGG